MTSFDEIKQQCLRDSQLFEDPEFPANSSSYLPSRRNQIIDWKRPPVSYLHFMWNVTVQLQSV